MFEIFSYVELYLDRTIRNFPYVELYLDHTIHICSYVELWVACQIDHVSDSQEYVNMETKNTRVVFQQQKEEDHNEFR